MVFSQGSLRLLFRITTRVVGSLLQGINRSRLLHGKRRSESSVTSDRNGRGVHSLHRVSQGFQGNISRLRLRVTTRCTLVSFDHHLPWGLQDSGLRGGKPSYGSGSYGSTPFP